MALNYNVPESKIKRVIVDTDAACEADDPFAIAHALMSRKLDVKAILANLDGFFSDSFCRPKCYHAELSENEIHLPPFREFMRCRM